MLDFTIASNIKKAAQILEMSKNLSKFKLIMGELLDEGTQARLEKMKESLGPIMSNGRPLYDCIGVDAECIEWAEFLSSEFDPEYGGVIVKFRMSKANTKLQKKISCPHDSKLCKEWLGLTPGTVIWFDGDDPFTYSMTFVMDEFESSDLEKIKSLGWKITGIGSTYMVTKLDGSLRENPLCLLYVEK